MIPKRSILAWALVATAVVFQPGLAGAQVGTLPAARTLCDNAITKRTGDLQTAKTVLDAAAHVTAGDRSNLDGQIQAAVSGLNTLKTAIDADATLVKLRADCRMIVTAYRVYVLLLPKIRLVVAADRAQAAADSLRNLSNLLRARVTADQASGKNATLAQGYVTDMEAKVQTATAAASAVPGTVLPLPASGYPGNRPTLVGARSSMATAAAALSAALQDASKAIAALKALG